MRPKLKPGQRFDIGGNKCEITSTTSFSGIKHYGFIWLDEKGVSQCGWMPCVFVENYTGYEQ